MTALQQWFGESGVSLRQLASHTGVGRTTMSQLARGKTSVSLSDALDMVVVSAILAPKKPLRLNDIPHTLTLKS